MSRHKNPVLILIEAIDKHSDSMPEDVRTAVVFVLMATAVADKKKHLRRRLMKKFENDLNRVTGN